MEDHVRNAENYISRSKSIFRFFKSRDDYLKLAYEQYVIASNICLQNSDINLSIYHLEKGCNLMFSILNYEDNVIENYLKLVKLSRYVDSRKYLFFSEKIVPIILNCNNKYINFLPEIYQGLIFFNKNSRNLNKVYMYYEQLIDYYRQNEKYRFGEIVSEYVDYSIRNDEDCNFKHLSNLLNEASLISNKYLLQTYLFESILIDIYTLDVEVAKEKLKRINSINKEFFLLSDLIFYCYNEKETNNTINKYRKIINQKWYYKLFI